MGKIPKKSSRKKAKKPPPTLTQVYRAHKDDVKVTKPDQPTAREAKFSNILANAAVEKPKKKRKKSKALELPGIARFSYESEEAYVKRASRITMTTVQQEMSQIREETAAEAADIRDAANKEKGQKRLRRNALKKHEEAKKRRVAKDDEGGDEEDAPAAAKSVRMRKADRERQNAEEQDSREKKARIEFSQKTERVSFGDTVSAPPTFTDNVRHAFGIDSSKKAGSRCPTILDMVNAQPSQRKGTQHKKKVNQTDRNDVIEAYRAMKKSRGAIRDD